MQPKALVVSSPRRRARLLEILEGVLVTVDCAAGCRDAKEILGRSGRYDLLLVDAELQDGSWHELQRFNLDSGKTAVTVVCARIGDHRLWAEVLESGAYDLITEPYEEQEVTRIVEGALQSGSMRRSAKIST